MPKQPQRITCSFPKNAGNHLDSIRQASRLKDATDIVWAALHCFKDLIEVTDAGYRVFVRSLNGEELLYNPYMKFAKAELCQPRYPVEVTKDAPQSIALKKEAAEIVDFIKTNSRFDKNADVLRMVLAAYDEMVNLVNNGHSMFLRHPEYGDQHFTPHAPLNRSRVPLGPTGQRPETSSQPVSSGPVSGPA